MQTSQRVLVIGSINMDLVVEVDVHPSPGDTVLGSDTKTFSGGKGANQAVAAAKAGANVTMLGCVGTDGYGDDLRNSLETAGVDIASVEGVSGSSGLAFITVDSNGENMIVVSSGANHKLTPELLKEEHFENVGLVLMQLEVPLETVDKAAAMARSRDIPVILNAAPAQKLDEALLEKLDILVVNEGEAALLSGVKVDDEASVEQASRHLIKKGVKTVIVTLGSAGVVYVNADTVQMLDAHEVKVVDTTAAGDAFCGALATALIKNKSLAEGVAFANATGALTTTKAGAQPSLPTRDQIDAFLEAS